MSITFTEYMNKTLAFREVLKSYCLEKDMEAQSIRNVLKIIDVMDNNAIGSKKYRQWAYDWFCGKTGTIELRELCKKIGVDYWENLLNSNCIDILDSVQLKFN